MTASICKDKAKRMQTKKPATILCWVLASIRDAKTVLVAATALFACASSLASDGSVTRHVKALKEVSDLVEAGRFDDALAEIVEQKRNLNKNDYVDRLYIVYFNNKEGYAYYRLGDMCRSESAYRESLGGAIENIKISDEVIAQNYIALSTTYIGMNDGGKERYLLTDVSNFVRDGVDNVSQTTMFSLMRILISLNTDVGNFERAEELLSGLSASPLPMVVERNADRDALLTLLSAAIEQGKGNGEVARRLYESAFRGLGLFDNHGSKKFPVELANYARLARSLGDITASSDAVERAKVAARSSKRNADQTISGIVGRSRNLGVPGLLCDGMK